MMRPTLLATARVAFTFAALAAISPLAGCGADLGSGEDLAQQQDGVDSNIDMADYILPSCDQASPTWQIGSETFRVVPMGMKDGLGRFVIVKSPDGSGYEEWAIDSTWLRIHSDTTWAYQLSAGSPWCDVKCGDNGADNCQQRWNTDTSDPLNGISPSSPWALTIYHEPGDPSLPAPFVLRKLTLPMGGEERFTAWMEIKGVDRASCAACWVNFGTKDGQSVPRTVLARRYATWHSFSDVVHLAVESGPGAGENYYYARGKGWIGFNDKVASGESPNTPMPQSICADFQPGSACEAVGKPSSQPPQPPPSNPPPGSCECRSDANNFCLYAAKAPGCAMTAPGGYCDPNGDGGFEDADWERGYYDYQQACGSPAPQEPPPPPPESPCECKGDTNNFCLYPAATPGCAMTAPGGYCDPNGDGGFDDADWERGYYDYQETCK